MSLEKARRFMFAWEIHNFSLAFYKKGDAIDSPVFEIDSFGGSQWYVRLYPRGERITREDLLSCYLHKQKNDNYSEETSLTFELELLANGNRLGIATTENFTYRLKERHGFERYMYTSTISDSLKAMMENVLTVRCHMFDTNKRNIPPDLIVQTKIPGSRVSFLWNKKNSELFSQPVSKDIVFNEKSLYEITMSLSEDYVKIRINQKEESSFPMLVSCTFTLVDSKGTEVTSKNSSYLFETNDKKNVWMFPSFITKADLGHEKDTFSLFCEFFGLHGLPSSTNCIISSGSSAKATKSNRTVLQDLKSMLNNRIHTDIKVKAEEQVLHAHKSILSARSPVFSAMFDQNMTESNTGVVEISDLEVNVLKLFLDFLYTDTIEDFDYEKAKKLFVAADKYQVTSLAEKCASFLESNLTLANATEILSVADMIGHEHLKKVVMNFVAENSVIIFNTPEWRDLVTKNVELAGEMFSVIASSFKVVPTSKLA